MYIYNILKTNPDISNKVSFYFGKFLGMADEKKFEKIIQMADYICFTIYKYCSEAKHESYTRLSWIHRIVSIMNE